MPRSALQVLPFLLVLAIAIACDERDSSGGDSATARLGDATLDAGALRGDARLPEPPPADGGRRGVDLGPPPLGDAGRRDGGIEPADAGRPVPGDAGPPAPTDAGDGAPDSTTAGDAERPRPDDAGEPPPLDAAPPPRDAAVPPPPRDAAPPPPRDAAEPPPADRANLVVFNRGLQLEQVIDRITVRPGSELWTVDPDRARSERRIVPADGAAHLMPAWSGDKSRIVFASTRGAPAGGPAYLNLWTVTHEGADPRRLTDTDAHDWTPAWSPDGRWVAFGSTRGKRDRASVSGLDIWLVDAQSGATRVLYAGPGQDEDPVFSRDSRTVYFNTGQDVGACYFQIWQVPVDGNTDTAAPVRDSRGRLLCGEDPSVSPDGDLLVVNQGGLRRLELATGRLVDHGDAQEPWIGPDGRRFVYMVDHQYIHVDDLGRGSDRRITSAGSDFFPRWSP